MAEGAQGEVVVDGVVVAPPLTEQVGRRLAPLGLLADRPDTLLVAWGRIEDMWAATVARARPLGPDVLTTRVDGEWSFVETQRHLVFVTDAWIGRVVEGAEAPHHPLGLPPHFITDAADRGLDLDATPTPDEVLAVRAGRMAHAREVIAATGPDDLGAPRLGRFTVLGALQVVIHEESAHHRYAVRDLARLSEGRT